MEPVTEPQTSPAGAQPQVVVITGLSGAGRRTAAHAMEDVGWYVVDNLPPALLPELFDMVTANGVERLAVILDVRTRDMFEQLPGVFDQLAKRGAQVEVVYLEASDDVIVRRQESSKRPLPLQGHGRLLDGIHKERALLRSLRAVADMVIDTTSLTVHQLTHRLATAFGGGAEKLRIQVMSFGFKNGLPLDADLVFDVRFLPNPHWIPELRPQTGLSEGVSSYVLSQPGAQEFLDIVTTLVETMAPGYEQEGKRLVTIAIGCTGGKHRSIAISEAVTARLREVGIPTTVMHRDLGRE